jgi:hypothetical protein
MIDIIAIKEKLDTLVEYGENKGADWYLLHGYGDQEWNEQISDLKLEILCDIAFPNLEAEKDNGPSLVELCLQLGKIEEVSGVVK